MYAGICISFPNSNTTTTNNNNNNNDDDANDNDNANSKAVLLQVVVLKFWPLDARIQIFGRKHRILCKISDLEPDSEVWIRQSRPKSVQFC